MTQQYRAKTVVVSCNANNQLGEADPKQFVRTKLSLFHPKQVLLSNTKPKQSRHQNKRFCLFVQAGATQQCISKAVKNLVKSIKTVVVYSFKVVAMYSFKAVGVQSSWWSKHLSFKAGGVSKRLSFHCKCMFVGGLHINTEPKQLSFHVKQIMKLEFLHPSRHESSKQFGVSESKAGATHQFRHKTVVSFKQRGRRCAQAGAAHQYKSKAVASSK